eukprot:PITA_35443
MSGYATAQKILRTGYFWPSLFKYCITAIQKYHNFQIFVRKMHAPPALLHYMIVVGPFAKWSIDFITCNPHSAGGHAYIILAVDYFTKWAKAMPTFSADVKTSIGFTPSQLVYGLEAVLPIECEIPSLEILVQLLPTNFEEEKHLLYLAQLDENRCNAALDVETHAKQIKSQYDQNVTPRNFSEGDLVLLYDQANDKLGAGKFVPMWRGLYIFKRKLEKGPMS